MMNFHQLDSECTRSVVKPCKAAERVTAALGHKLSGRQQVLSEC